MSIYHKFAYDYDELIDQERYIEWYDFIISKVKNYHHVLDLGCGTGVLASMLANDDVSVIGIDLSEEMLSIAYNKALETQKRIQFFVADMSEFSLNQKFDLITCLCDSINYIEDPKLVFNNVYNHLESNGYFLFDALTPYYCNHLMKDYLEEEEDYKWKVKNIGYNIIRHDVYIEDYHEIHIEKTFSKDEYVKMLNDVGFNDIEVYTDFKDYNELGNRNLFLVRKR